MQNLHDIKHATVIILLQNKLRKATKSWITTDKTHKQSYQSKQRSKREFPVLNDLCYRRIFINKTKPTVILHGRRRDKD